MQNKKVPKLLKNCFRMVPDGPRSLKKGPEMVPLFSERFQWMATTLVRGVIDGMSQLIPSVLEMVSHFLLVREAPPKWYKHGLKMVEKC